MIERIRTYLLEHELDEPIDFLSGIIQSETHY